MTIAENLTKVRENIARAAKDAGLDERDILLIGATKMTDAARVREALPREWRDLQVADSAASVKLFLKDADGAVTAVGAAAWFRGHRTGLIRLKSVEGLPLLERVPAGDVSRTVQWLVLGALDAAGQERSDG